MSTKKSDKMLGHEFVFKCYQLQQIENGCLSIHISPLVRNTLSTGHVLFTLLGGCASGFLSHSVLKDNFNLSRWSDLGLEGPTAAELKTNGSCLPPSPSATILGPWFSSAVQALIFAHLGKQAPGFTNWCVPPCLFPKLSQKMGR